MNTTPEELDFDDIYSVDLTHSSKSPKYLPRQIPATKVDCSEMEAHLRENYRFEAVMFRNITNDKVTHIPLTVELVHFSDWAQFMHIQENPRLLLNISAKEPIKLEPLEVVEFHIYLHPIDTLEAPLRILQRTFSEVEQSSQNCESFLSTRGCTNSTTRLDFQELSVERSFGMYKAFCFNLIKHVRIESSLSQAEYVEPQVSTQFSFVAFQHHFSIWEIYRALC
jgi:hypothetical protein